MKAAFYAGAAGLMAHQQGLNTIGQNLANVNTKGYQRETISFENLLYSRMYANAETDPYHGVGVKAVSTGIQVGGNAMSSTGEPLDFAIVGDGFFAVQNGDQRQYTRAGMFAISLEGDNTYLTTQAGLPVVGKGGGRIQITRSPNGGFDYSDLQDRIEIFRFDYPGALDPIAGTAYLPTELSGEAQVSGAGENKILSRTLENSGTSMADEMNNLIAAQRGYQLSARVVQVSDEIEQEINNLRK